MVIRDKFKKIVGHFIDIDENDEINKEILENHINRYMISVFQVLGVAFFLLTLFEITVMILIRNGYFSYLLIDFYGRKISYKNYVISQIIFQFLIWSTFGLFSLCWSKANFTQRKKLLSALAIITTTLFCFYHWKNNSLSIIFIIPIIVAVPLDKKRNKEIMVWCIVLIIIYSIFQFALRKNESSLLIACSCIVTMVAVQHICIKIHNTMNRSFLDIKNFATKEKVLYDKISHDELTGSFSKTALESDLKNLIEYTSLAFIDIDKFKVINDTYGHSMGDNILKLLVFCFNTKNIHIYRNGGDEFIILSHLTASELADKLNTLKTKYTFYSKEFFNVKSTLSIGIITIDQSQTGSENIRRCDALMYESKDKGRDTLTLEESK